MHKIRLIAISFDFDKKCYKILVDNNKLPEYTIENTIETSLKAAISNHFAVDPEFLDPILISASLEDNNIVLYYKVSFPSNTDVLTHGELITYDQFSEHLDTEVQEKLQQALNTKSISIF